MNVTRLLVCGLLTSVAAAAQESSARLVLTDHNAEIDILGIVADIVVRRTYRYEGDGDATLMFAFPVSPATDLASVTISTDSVPAVLSGFVPGATKRARSLLAVDRMVQPGGTVTVDMRYTETLIRTGGVYELVYPTALGTGSLTAVPSGVAVSGAAQSTVVPGDTLRTTASVTLTGGLPIAEFACVSHRAETWFEGEGLARMLPSVDGPNERQRDLVVRYRLAGDEAIPEIYTFEAPDGELLLMVGEPPLRGDGTALVDLWHDTSRREECMEEDRTTQGP